MSHLFGHQTDLFEKSPRVPFVQFGENYFNSICVWYASNIVRKVSNELHLCFMYFSKVNLNDFKDFRTVTLGAFQVDLDIINVCATYVLDKLKNLEKLI